MNQSIGKISREDDYVLEAVSDQQAAAVSGHRGSGQLTVRLSGTVSIHNAGRFLPEAELLLERFSSGSPGESASREFVLDLGGVEYLDSAGALAIFTLRAEAARRSVSFSLVRTNPETTRIFEMIEREQSAPAAREIRTEPGFLERTGLSSIRWVHHAVLFLLFVGDLAESLLASLVQPRKVRWEAVFFYMKRAGLDGLPIVGLISILLGLIMAFMASLQLRQFGANIYVASLVAVAIVRELGPIMTAIIYAGRSGSAFSAEIGTMLVNEEIDALNTMGFDPVHFLVIPKVIASILVVPILTIYADLLGILGGMVVGIVGMDLTAQSYLDQTMRSIKIFDLVWSMFKSGCFAVLISGISCQRGFQARGGAQAVGSVTTSAVVSSIFLIVIADSAFAIMTNYIR